MSGLNALPHLLWTVKHFYRPRWQSLSHLTCSLLATTLKLAPPRAHPGTKADGHTELTWEVQGHWQGGREGFRQGEAARTAHQLPLWAAAAYSCRAGLGNGRKHTSESPRSMVTVLEYLSPDTCKSLGGLGGGGEGAAFPVLCAWGKVGSGSIAF